MKWSDYSFYVGLFLGAGAIGIFWATHWLDMRSEIQRISEGKHCGRAGCDFCDD